MKKQPLPGRAFTIVSLSVLLSVLALVWILALRENKARQTGFEYEVYRASTNLVEEYFQDPSSIELSSPILGFGIYSPKGGALLRQGSAPESFELKRPFFQSFSQSIERSSVILIRLLGAEENGARMRGMMRGMQGMRPRPSGAGEEAPPAPVPLAEGNPPQARPSQAPASQANPRILWIEFSTGGFARARIITIGASFLISLGIVVLYLVLVLFWKRNNELRLKDEKNRELVQLGEAARTLVHEIKNPLAVIRIQSSTLRRMAETGLDPANLGSRLDIVDEEVIRLSNLSDRIREFLKSGEGEAKPVDLGEFLGDFARRYRGRPAGEDQADEPLLLVGELPKGALAFIDPSRLAQCLDNLLRNAIEASPAGEAVELGLHAHGKNWEISVADRGAGLAPGSEDRLFEPFFTTKEKGTGIGLALARKVAESAGGSLVYSHRPEGGSVFTVSLPRFS